MIPVSFLREKNNNIKYLCESDLGEELFTIEVNGKKLTVYFGYQGEDYENLNGGFRSDKEVAKFISDDLDMAYRYAIGVHEKDSFLLDIDTIECFGNFSWEDGWPKSLLNQQLTTYMPIIQKFIADAVTNSGIFSKGE